MSSSRHLLTIALPILLVAATTLRADVQLPAIFSDHMVLSRSAKVPVWGKADSGEKVVITLGDAKAEATADSNGRWQADLDLSRSRPGPFTLIISGKNRRIINDVLVGEVWRCAGQSNMEWSLRSTLDAATEIPRSTNTMLRQFRVKKTDSDTPLDSCEGEWIFASPQTAKRFSAVAYYFGKALQKELNVPVGLINNSWGGTPIEAWTSQSALHTDVNLKEVSIRERERLKTYPEKLATYLSALKEWQKITGREDRDFPGLPSI